MKVLCAPMEIKLGHPEENGATAMSIIEANKTADYILLPPLFLTGCSCGSLFEYDFFIEKQNLALNNMILAMPPKVRVISTIIKAGKETPIMFDDCGIMDINDINIATNISELVSGKTNFLCLKHKWIIGSLETLVNELKGYTVYFTSAGKGESGTGYLYSSACGCVMGSVYTARQFTPILIDDRAGFESVIREPDIYPDPIFPFVPEDNKYLDEAIDILSYALRRRLDHLGSDKVVIGISGGLDSTLALLIANNVISDKKDITGITMPGMGTGDTTKGNADKLMEILGIDARTISVKSAVHAHFRDIGHDGITPDIAYENAQARERMQILFDISNMKGALNVGTGDLSEAMLGFTTFGGDHLSMYALNIGVPKTLVKALVLHFAKRLPKLSTILLSIAATPISPELVPGNQQTESIVGSYKANDFAIYHTVVSKMGKTELKSLMEISGLDLELDNFYRRITNAQFKRNCSPDGVAVTRCSVAPGGDFTIPSDCKNVF